MKELKKCILILIIFMSATLMILNIDERGRQNTGFGGDIAQSVEEAVEYVFAKLKMPDT